MLIMISISQLTNWVWIKYLNLIQLIHIFETAEQCMLYVKSDQLKMPVIKLFGVWCSLVNVQIKK